MRPIESATAYAESRVSTGGASTSQSQSGAPAPYWLKLIHVGNTFSGYRSPDGATWTLIGEQTIPTMAANIYVGLSVTARDNTKLNTSSFDSVSVSSSTTLASAAITSSAPATLTTAASKLLDGSVATYFQSAAANGAWVGVDFGKARTITGIKFAPRSGFESRMIGGTFQVSNTADFSSGVATLFVIKKAPKGGAITAQPVSPGKAYRYVRYLAPNGSFGNIAETSFVGF